MCGEKNVLPLHVVGVKCYSGSSGLLAIYMFRLTIFQCSRPIAYIHKVHSIVPETYIAPGQMQIVRELTPSACRGQSLHLDRVVLYLTVSSHTIHSLIKGKP